MKSTFQNTDCIYLLKDLTGIIDFTPFEEKEKNISDGINYSEMITEEEPLSEEVNRIFHNMLAYKAEYLARYTEIVSNKIFSKSSLNTIIVSLARAGSPIGALIKRYIKFKYNVDVPHYSISIIRDRGIDKNALNYIRKIHPTGIITFVDGWTGKGSITSELNKSICEYNKETGASLSPDLAVLADPARLSTIAGTRKDVCIPNACLNSTISGLISRTILNHKYIAESDYHGAVRYENLNQQDVTNFFLDTIESKFPYDCGDYEEKGESCGETIKEKLKSDFPIANINKVKLSIGESSRALLRRVPYIVLVKDKTNPDLSFILHLAKTKGVEVIEYDTMDYECITLLR